MKYMNTCFEKLKPHLEVDACKCESIESLLLIDILTANPIHCGVCKSEVAPEALALEESLVNEIASWRSTYQSLYLLWLDSGEYESYAKERLLDCNSQVNLHGLKIVKHLSSYHPTYYWWFYDSNDVAPSCCPSCNNFLNKNVRFGIGKCEACLVAL